MAIRTNAKLKLRQLEVTAPTGTPGLVVASTTKVTNLNADRVDDAEPANFGAIGVDLVFTGSQNLRRNTADGADNGYIAIMGGGALGATRSSYAVFYGNEVGGGAGGQLHFGAGNVAGAAIIFNTAATERARITDTGKILIGTTTDVGSTVAAGGIRVAGASHFDAKVTLAYSGAALRIDDTVSYYPIIELWAKGGGAVSAQVARIFGYSPGALWTDADSLRWASNSGVEHMRVTNSHNLLIGGTDVEGGTHAAGGDVVIRGGGRAYRSVNTAGLSTLPLISLSANDRTTLHGTLEITAFGAVSGVTGGPSYALPANPATWIPVYIGTAKYAIPLYNAT